jgi:hypothetical protein
MILALMTPPEVMLYYVRAARFMQIVQTSTVPAADVADWTISLIIRRTQSDDSPALLTCVGTWLTPANPALGAMAEFIAAAADTANLPAGGAAYYVDAVNGISGAVHRVLMGRMEASD